MANGLLYAARSVSRGEVVVYQLAGDGNFADGTVLVDETIGPSDVQNPAQCPISRGCTSGATCGDDADCAGCTIPDGAAVGTCDGAPGVTCATAADCPQNIRCVSGSCVNLQQSCAKNKDCGEQTCAAYNPCDQDFERYPVSSANCTSSIPLTDASGNTIVGRGGSPLTVRAEITPYARRRRLNGAGPLIVRDGVVYVSERFRRAVSMLPLCTQSEPFACPARGEPVPTGKQGAPCTCPDENQDRAPDVPDLCPPGGFSVDAKFNAEGVCTARQRQPRGVIAGSKQDGSPRYKGGRTRNDIRYNALVLAQGSDATSILGAQFLDGRIDGYRLKGDGRLPTGKTRETDRNFRTSPFQMFVWNGVLFVGAGEIDRVQAYRLNAQGLPRDRNPYAETVRLPDTFPNAVIVAELGPGGDCPVLQ